MLRMGLALLLVLLCGNAQGKDLPDTPEASAVFFPEEYGSVETVHQGDSGRLVIVLQDAHANELAQQNVSKIIPSLRSSYGIDLIGVEGSSGVVDTALYATFPVMEAKELVTQFLLRQGKINGAEAAGILDARPLWIFGVEDPELYIENHDGLMQSTEARVQAGAVLARMAKQTEFLKQALYSPELKQWDDAGAGLDECLRKAGELGVSLSGLTHIAQYRALLEREKSVATDAVDRERNAAVQKLSQVLPMAELKALTEATLRWRAGSLSPLEYHRSLQKRLAAKGLAFEALAHYTEYLTMLANTDRQGLQSDSQTLRTRIFEHLAGPDDALKRLHDTQKTLVLLDKFLRLRASALEYAWYLRQRPTAAALVSTLQALSQRRGMSFSLSPAELAVLQTGLDKAFDFYEAALQRDGIMAANLAEEMQKTGRKAAILLAGGFHADGICRYLKAKGFSYVLAMPKVGEAGSEKRYMALLTDKNTPYLDVYRKSARADVLSGAIGLIGDFSDRQFAKALMINTVLKDAMSLYGGEWKDRKEDSELAMISQMLAVGSAVAGAQAQGMPEQWEELLKQRGQTADREGMRDFADAIKEDAKLLNVWSLFGEPIRLSHAQAYVPVQIRGAWYVYHFYSDEKEKQDVPKDDLIWAAGKGELLKGHFVRVLTMRGMGSAAEALRSVEPGDTGKDAQAAAKFLQSA